MKIKKFNQINESRDFSSYTYYDMTNGYMQSLMDILDRISEENKGIVSTYYEYDKVNNVLEIQVVSDELANKVREEIEGPSVLGVALDRNTNQDKNAAYITPIKMVCLF